MLIATMARVANLYELVSPGWAAAHIATGCLGGLLVVFVGTSWRRRSESDEAKAATAPLPVSAMWESLRSFDEHARDGVRRAVPLAVLMYFFQLDGGRDAFWTFFAAYLVFSLGVVILFTGVGLSPPYPIVAGALTTIGSVLLAGAPTGDATSWAGHRLLDTLLGCAVALVATYLLWPRDRETEAAPVPAPTT
jgi:hypothetical protein